jgi:hypothetical protein
VGQHSSFLHARKTTEAYAKVRTGLGKSDRPGSQAGLWRLNYGNGYTDT